MHITDDIQQQKKLTELALKIKSAREAAHLSQDALGGYIGVSDKSISAYEQSRSTPPLKKLQKIAKYTKRPLSYFTQEAPADETITATLLSIEHEFREIKRLFKQAKK